MALNFSDKNKLNIKPKSVFIRLQKTSTKLLIVEGDGDVEFYGKYVLPEEIVCIDNTNDYINGDPDYKGPKNNAKSFVQFLVDKHLKRVKENTAITYGKCFGIIDKDFDGIDFKQYPHLGKSLITTDERDLETTLLKHDYNHLKELFSEDFNTDNSSIVILEKAINNASQIGKLRKLREDQRKTLHGKLTKDISINFKAKEPDDIGYLPFVTEDLDFAFDSYVGTQYSKEQISKLKKLKPFHTSKGSSILKIRGVFEDKLREYFDDSEFKSSSPMYQFIVSNFSETIPH